jgi:hypothetical protein
MIKKLIAYSLTAASMLLLSAAPAQADLRIHQNIAAMSSYRNL